MAKSTFNQMFMPSASEEDAHLQTPSSLFSQNTKAGDFT